VNEKGGLGEEFSYISMTVKYLRSIRITAEEMPIQNMWLSSSRPIKSPTAPSEPWSLAGWCDRFWIDKKPGENVAVRYWIFESVEQAEEAATEGRKRLSAKMIYVDGKREPIYQMATEPEDVIGDVTWRANNNILFVKSNVVVLVSESGRNVDVDTIRKIAKSIEEKIQSVLEMSQVPAE